LGGDPQRCLVNPDWAHFPVTLTTRMTDVTLFSEVILISIDIFWGPCKDVP